MTRSQVLVSDVQALLAGSPPTLPAAAPRESPVHPHGGPKILQQVRCGVRLPAHPVDRLVAVTCSHRATTDRGDRPWV